MYDICVFQSLNIDNLFKITHYLDKYVQEKKKINNEELHEKEFKFIRKNRIRKFSFKIKICIFCFRIY